MVSIKTLEKLGALTSKVRIVKRRYTNKKTGKAVQKEYSYSKAKLLFRKTSKGYKVINEAWNEFEDNIRKTAKDEVESRSLINRAREIRQSIVDNNGFSKYDIDSNKNKAHYNRETRSKKGNKTVVVQKGWHRIDASSMISRMATSEVEKYLINMGLTAEEVVNHVQSKGYVIAAADLLNPAKWMDDTAYVWTVDRMHLIEIVMEFRYDGVDQVKVREITDTAEMELITSRLIEKELIG